MKEGKLNSVLHNKCPHCNKGDVFESKGLISYKNFSKMNKSCSECGEDFNREVGFYYGAMYVSYGVTVAYLIGMTSIFVWFTGWFSLPGFFYFLFPSMLLLFPIFYRISRLIWLNIFVNYESSINQPNKA